MPRHTQSQKSPDPNQPQDPDPGLPSPKNQQVPQIQRSHRTPKSTEFPSPIQAESPTDLMSPTDVPESPPLQDEFPAPPLPAPRLKRTSSEQDRDGSECVTSPVDRRSIQETKKGEKQEMVKKNVVISYGQDSPSSDNTTNYIKLQ
ncbi:hypothetical protein WMY93_019060 [Mugilogobius chulae]|uniref:Uncharacterized protein n=1 Tax=Mugilogobius chulae TaxID=88201 RepID=A0AAW0NHN6_9GOBI